MRRLYLAGLAILLAAAGPAKEGMPQLDFKNPLLLSQVVWGAIVFALLYVALGRWALPKVGGVLEDRRSRIAGDLDTARAAKMEADAAVGELTEATRRARAEAQGSVASATQQAKAEAAERNAEIGRRVDAQLADAEKNIAAARNAAMGALKAVAIDAASAVVTRLTGHAPDPAQLDRAVEAMLPSPTKG